MTKQEIKLIENQLIEMTTTFCNLKINEEYAQLCEKLIKKLGRKKDVPFQKGKIEIWAATIVYTIGAVNFLFDKESDPYLTLSEINDYFGTKQSTVGNKSRDIREMLKLGHFNSEFSTKSVLSDAPWKKYVLIDGFIQPIEVLPEELLKELLEARAKGDDIEFFSEQ